MARWLRIYRGSIRMRLLALTTAVLLFMLGGAVVVLMTTLQITSEYSEKREMTAEKERLASDLAADAMQAVLHARGYLLYRSSYEHNQAYAFRAEMDKRLAALNQYPLTPEETDIIESIEDAMIVVFDIRFPTTFEMAANEDYDAIRSYVQADESNPTYDLIKNAERLEAMIADAVERNSEQLMSDISRQGIIFILYVLIILAVSSLFVRRIATDINEPLAALSGTAGKVAAGEPVQFEYLDREDEVGQLARSLETMMRNLLDKEETLLAQNEELIAQQDELQMQQEELQEALARTEESRRLLSRRNALVQSLAITLDKGELLDSIVRSIVELTSSDKGLIMLFNARRDYASFGMSAQAADRFVRASDESLMIRAVESRRIHVVVRQGAPGELIDDTENVYCTDAYVPIFGSDGGVTACILLTKIGRPYTQAEQDELAGLTHQISLALAKQAIYETSEHQHQLTYDMLNTMLAAVQLTDLTGRTIQVNTKWHELFGSSDAEAGNDMSLEQYLTLMAGKVADPDAFVQFIRQHYEGRQAESCNMQYELIGDVRRIIHVYIEPLNRDGEWFGSVLVHRDVTREYEVDRMKSEFVNTVSHELRTPLSSVLGLAELLLHRELKPERQRKYIATIHQEARRLTRLINDFLDLQRMDSGRQGYDMKAMPLSPMLEELLDEFKLQSAMHTFEMRDEADHSSVFADRDMMKQVFQNLLSNAVKYSPQGGMIRVELRTVGQQLIVSVADEGLGIPEEALPQLFDKFYRVDNTDRREIGGTGLGLAIVKEIVNGHKGEIDVKSALGQGSTFIVTLPLYQP